MTKVQVQAINDFLYEGELKSPRSDPFYIAEHDLGEFVALKLVEKTGSSEQVTDEGGAAKDGEAADTSEGTTAEAANAQGRSRRSRAS